MISCRAVPHPVERADRLMGTAEAVLAWPFDGPVH
jgi:hypothetical protein